MITKEMFLEKAVPEIEKVNLPELGEGEFTYVKGMTADERDTFESSIVSVSDDGAKVVKMEDSQMRAKVVALCMCDEDGNRLMEEKDVDRLGELSGKIITRVFSVAQRLSGMTLNDLKEMTKN